MNRAFPFLFCLALIGCESDPAGIEPGEPDAGIPDALLMPDAVPVGTSCDPVAQSGCAPEQKCSLIPSVDEGAEFRIGCVEGTGSRGLLESCRAATPVASDNCASGLVCRGAGPKALCHEFCSSSPADTCSGQQACAFGVDVDDDVFDQAEMCAGLCDPLAQDCPADQGFGCYPSRYGGICATVGGGMTPVDEGAACEFGNACHPGLGCFRLGVSPDWQCFRLCNPSDWAECSVTQFCNPVENEAWGICIEAQ